MTTFKVTLNANTGNLLLPLVISLTALAISYHLVNHSFINTKIGLVNREEAAILMEAHSIASLVKQEFAFNYGKYQNHPSWATCRLGNPNIDSFLSELKNPSQNCVGLELEFKYFKRKNFSGSAKLRLQSIFATDLYPTTAPSPFSRRVRIVEINTVRSQIMAELEFQSSSKVRGKSKTLSLVIDLARAINPPRGLASKICRNAPGLVCDSADLYLNISYLEGSGRIMGLSFDEATATSVISDSSFTSNNRTVSVKNLATARTDYYGDSFCIPLKQAGPIHYLIDAATDSSGKSYFLTTDGRLFNRNGASLWPIADPKYVSIAFYNETWLLLRSDGAVFRTASIEDSLSLNQVPGLYIRTAEKITSGSGPDVCP